jgi:hypothetical protein
MMKKSRKYLFLSSAQAILSLQGLSESQPTPCHLHKLSCHCRGHQRASLLLHNLSSSRSQPMPCHLHKLSCHCRDHRGASLLLVICTSCLATAGIIGEPAYSLSSAQAVLPLQGSSGSQPMPCHLKKLSSHCKDHQSFGQLGSHLLIRIYCTVM